LGLGRAVSGRVLFEQERNGQLWRLEIVSYRGRTFTNWRKWYSASGEWKPTKQGCTMPLERLADLTACLMAYHGLEAPQNLGG